MNEKDFEAYMKACESLPREPFKPHAWYNVDGNQMEVFWSEDCCYGTELKGKKGYSTMCLMRRQGDNVPVGVTIYSIRQLLLEMGFKIMPLTPNEVLDKFIKEHPILRKAEWLEGDLTVWFHDSEEPFGISEFEKGSDTRKLLEKLENALVRAEDYNDRQQAKDKGVSETVE